MTERQLELREYRREKQVMQEARIARTHEDAPKKPECRVLMSNSVWLVPESERPAIHIPNERKPESSERGPDYRRNLVAAKSGSKVVRA